MAASGGIHVLVSAMPAVLSRDYIAHALFLPAGQGWVVQWMAPLEPLTNRVCLSAWAAVWQG